MAKYSDPDQWFGSTDGKIPAGIGGGMEPIAQSMTATNRAAYTMLPLVQAVNGVVQVIQSAVLGLPGKVVDAIVAKRWAFGNQDGVPPEKRGTDNLFESTAATNTRVFHPNWGLKATADRLAAVEKKLDALAAKLDPPA